MKLQNTIDKALFLVLVFVLTAMFSDYPGLIKVKCSAEGCEMVIDGREPIK
jgi:hypothetical protein